MWGRHQYKLPLIRSRLELATQGNRRRGDEATRPDSLAPRLELGIATYYSESRWAKNPANPEKSIAVATFFPLPLPDSREVFPFWSRIGLRSSDWKMCVHTSGRPISIFISIVFSRQSNNCYILLLLLLLLLLLQGITHFLSSPRLGQETETETKTETISNYEVSGPDSLAPHGGKIGKTQGRGRAWDRSQGARASPRYIFKIVNLFYGQVLGDCDCGNAIKPWLNT